jgi:hypothetical protein
MGEVDNDQRDRGCARSSGPLSWSLGPRAGSRGGRRLAFWRELRAGGAGARGRPQESGVQSSSRSR